MMASSTRLVKDSDRKPRCWGNGVRYQKLTLLSSALNLKCLTPFAGDAITREIRFDKALDYAGALVVRTPELTFLATLTAVVVFCRVLYPSVASVCNRTIR